MGKPKKDRRLDELSAMARSKYMRISPRKLNLVASMIRGRAAEKALADLQFSNRRIARDVRKVLQAAIANAENNHQLDVDRLVVREATVGKTLSIKRYRPRARGRAGRIVKPFSNLTIVVGELEEAA